MANLRNHQRVNVDRFILVTLSDGKVIKAKMINLSQSGLAICYPAPGEVGAQLGLTFQLPDGDDVMTIQARGIVKHSHIRHEEFVTGIEFTALEDEHAKCIATFLQRKHGSGGTARGFVVTHRHSA